MLFRRDKKGAKKGSCKKKRSAKKALHCISFPTPENMSFFQDFNCKCRGRSCKWIPYIHNAQCNQIDPTADYDNYDYENYEMINAKSEKETESQKNLKACPSPNALGDRGNWDCSDEALQHKAVCAFQCKDGFEPVGIRISQVLK